MKKNNMMRLSALLLVAVLLTTCVISGTFAKYVSNGSAGDTARVAKWGVVIEATDDGDAGRNVLDELDDANEAHISVAKELKLMAPGTYGDLVNVNVSGQPEVAVNVAVTFSIDLVGWEIRLNDTNGDDIIDENDDATEYCPLVITVNGTDYAIDAGNDAMDTVAELEAAVEAAVLAVNADYPADSDLNSILDLNVSWKWAFVGNDVNDTALGDLATAPTMTVAYTIAITQID